MKHSTSKLAIFLLSFGLYELRIWYNLTFFMDMYKTQSLSHHFDLSVILLVAFTAKIVGKNTKMVVSFSSMLFSFSSFGRGDSDRLSGFTQYSGYVRKFFSSILQISLFLVFVRFAKSILQEFVLVEYSHGISLVRLFHRNTMVFSYGILYALQFLLPLSQRRHC